MRRRRLRITRRLGLVLIGPRQHVVQFMEGVIAAHFRIADRRLDAVIARDESRIDRPHARAARFRRVVFLGQARTSMTMVDRIAISAAVAIRACACPACLGRRPSTHRANPDIEATHAASDCYFTQVEVACSRPLNR